MLIIEGGDLVGKTTFCKALLAHPVLQEHAYLYNHMTKPPETFDGCQAYIGMAYQRYVQDRYHLSEIMYAPLRNDPPKVTAEKYRIIDAHLRLLGALTVVVVCSDPQLIAERWEARKADEMYDLALTLEANARFAGVCDRRHVYVGVNVYHPDIDLVIRTSASKPFPTASDVEDVIQLYENRQKLVGELLDS